MPTFDAAQHHFGHHRYGIVKYSLIKNYIYMIFITIILFMLHGTMIAYLARNRGFFNHPGISAW